MKSLLFILVSAFGGLREQDTRHVDLLELNHKYDDHGKHVYSQVIAWRKDPAKGTYAVAEWKLVEYRESVPSVPKQTSSGRYRVYWPGEFGESRLRFVESAKFRESWTMLDPERENLKQLPQHERALLWSVRGLKALMKEVEETP